MADLMVIEGREQKRGTNSLPHSQLSTDDSESKHTAGNQKEETVEKKKHKKMPAFFLTCVLSVPSPEEGELSG